MDVPLKPLRSSAKTKIFKATPLTVQTYRSKEKGTIAIGFVIYDVNGSELILQGDVDYGSTLNEAELYAIL